MTHDSVNHPAHYTSDPSGVECIQITRHRTFNIGNAIKYLWRNGLKRDAGRTDVDKQIEDLEKAVWYINDEIEMLRGPKPPAEVVGFYYGHGLIQTHQGVLTRQVRERDCS